MALYPEEVSSSLYNSATLLNRVLVRAEYKLSVWSASDIYSYINAKCEGT